ncbi:MAG: hypothetical protein JW754_00575 [Candidatus Aenigmarchaeota archaeon]|nr:hypothetical protein [Candidatus Aenigmarchaeota archaeon]
MGRDFADLDHLHEHGVTYRKGPNTGKLVYISFDTQKTFPAEQIGGELTLKRVKAGADPEPSPGQIPEGADAYTCSVWPFAGKGAGRPTEYRFRFLSKLPEEKP